MSTRDTRAYTLDPVTFEVLKNAYVNTVDQMAEQILRTCHSFVIYARDFSSALCDLEGDTIMHGTQDIAVHVGTLHYTAKAVLERFEGDINAGDVFAINDPYLGGTHFNDVRIIRPIFVDGEVICYAQSCGHWADVGGSVPGSFDITAKEHFGEGLRIPPVRIWAGGKYLDDVVGLISSNSRVPTGLEGDLHAQAEATRVAEQEILRLVNKYGKETVTTGFTEVQDYVEQLTRQRIAEMPDGTWETEDYIDYDPAIGEGLIPIKVKMTIEGDEATYDLNGSHRVVGSFLNAAFGTAFSGIIGGTKTFFPDIPLNSGFYRPINFDLGPEGSVVNAPWPTAVTGFCSGPYEKLMNSIFELWSGLMPERAIACSFNLEYLLVGGRDARREGDPYFMWYDWMAGGWGGRNGKDGSNACAPLFGPGIAVQPAEGQERLSPVVTTEHAIRTDSGGPGRFRGGCGIEKGGTLSKNEQSVMSYCCDRARSIAWGINGGLPSLPHGLWLSRAGTDEAEFLGAVFSSVPVGEGDRFTRPSAGGGGFGDPLERDRQAVLDDVTDEYVSVERAKIDYGVVVQLVDADLAEYELDLEATEAERARIRSERKSWLAEDPESVAKRYRGGELSALDLVRHYGVIVDWGTGEVLPDTTETFRAMMARRARPLPLRALRHQQRLDS